MSRAKLSEELHKLLPGEKDKRIRAAIMLAYNGSSGIARGIKDQIDQENRLRKGLINSGTLDINSPTSATLDLFAWVIDYEIFQPGSVPKEINAPDDNFPRVDYFHGDNLGVIHYSPGTIDAEGNSIFPTIAQEHVLLTSVIRNPDGTNTIVPIPADNSDFFSKSQEGTQKIQSELSVAPQAGLPPNVAYFDINGVLRGGIPARTGIYSTLQGIGGFSKLVTINIDPANQLNYYTCLEFHGVSPEFEKGFLWVQFRIDLAGDIIQNALKCFGEFGISRYKLIKTTENTYSLFVAHDNANAFYKFRPIGEFGGSNRYEYHHLLPKLEDLPDGDQYDFSAFAGTPGIAGKQVELQKSATHIQWRYVGDPDWTNLVSLAEIQGDDGDDGLNGWTPILAVVADGERRVHQVVNWTGGTGSKPTAGLFVGESGFVVLVGDGVDIRGAAGPAGSGGGEGTGEYLTDLDTWPILKFDKNYRYIHEMSGAVTISAQKVSPIPEVGTVTKLYIKANGVIPILSSDYEVVWDNYSNVSGHWNRLLFEWTPEGKGIVQIEQIHLGTPNDGSGLTEIIIDFDNNYIKSHTIINSTKIILNTVGALVGYNTTLYIKADGINKPFYGSDIVVTYDNYINIDGVWNRFKLEWSPDNKAILQIINT